MDRDAPKNAVARPTRTLKWKRRTDRAGQIFVYGEPFLVDVIPGSPVTITLTIETRLLPVSRATALKVIQAIAAWNNPKGR